MTSTDDRALIYCITCGTEWTAHTDVCSRHPYRPTGTDAHGRPLPSESIELTEAELAALLEYSNSIPTGVFIGKRWKCDANVAAGVAPLWLVGEFVPGSKPETARVQWYRVKLKEVATV